MHGNEEITTWKVVRRLARKMSRPGVLRSFIESRRLAPETVDSMGLRLEEAATAWPDRPALKFEDRILTWSQANARVNQYAHALADLGIAKGDVVVVNVTNRPEMLLSLMGLMKIGAIGALINTGLRGESLHHSMRVISPRAAIVGEEQFEAIETVSSLATVTDTWIWCADAGDAVVPDGWIDLAGIAAEAPTSNPASTRQVTLGDTAVFIYTSGTTGLPKAAVTGHLRARMGGLLLGRALLELRPDDTLYNALPLYHSTGLIGSWSSCLHTGAALAIGRRFSASTFWDEIRRHDVTVFTYVGEVLRYLLNQPPSPDDPRHHVRAVYGAGLRPEIWDEFKGRFGIDNVCEFYGSSEAPAGFLNFLNFDKTIGWNPRGWKAVSWDNEAEEPVRGRDGFMQEVGPDGTGLLLFKIDESQRFEGYTDNDATQRKVFRDVFEPGDAWFNSGDLVEKLGHGHARFKDRTGDTFRWNGENVATTEVEAVIAAFPQVEQAVAYGVDVPGADGRCGMALIVPRNGQQLDGAGLTAHLRTHLPAYAVPRFVRVGTEVDMTGTFKYRKVDLKRDGWDPKQVDGTVLILPPDEDTFRQLTDDDAAAIRAGTLRL